MQTRAWLERRRGELARRHAGGGILLALGCAAAALAAGVLLGRLGLYTRAPLTVIGGWAAAFAALAVGIGWFRRRRGATEVGVLAVEVERTGRLRRGSIAGVAAYEARAGSAELAAVADRRAHGWLVREGRTSLAGVRRDAARSLGLGALALLVGGGLLAASLLRPGQGAAFWRPFEVLGSRKGAIRLTVDRTDVRRGDTVTVRIAARGWPDATLWVRAPGEPWSSSVVALDTAGRALTRLGPLDSDRFLLATTGGKSSDTIQVRVALPAFLAELQLLARYPSYLERPDEPLAPGPDTVLVPGGTRIFTRGTATVEIAEAAWRLGDAAVALDADGTAFTGALGVYRSGSWRLVVRPVGADSLDEPAPELTLVAVRDSAPVVTVPVPGADTIAPLSLTLPLVIDSRDDHGLTAVELVSWRVTRLGERRPPTAEPIQLPEGVSERLVLQWVLDLNGRGFLPGDTAFFKVRASDNAPEPNVGESRTYALRLPAMGELRRAMREAADAVKAGADSLVAGQRELARQIEDLAAERERGEAPERGDRGADRSADQLPFNSVERARELADRQEEALARAQQMREDLRELQEAAWNAGLTDPEFQKQLQDLRELLEQALTQDIARRLQELRDALERLDAPSVREALEELAQAAEELREQLDRGRELFERAALEGQMTTLADDADELARRQEEWNRQAQQRVDSAMAGIEEMLAAQAESLAAQLGRLQAQLDTMSLADAMQAAQQRAGDASQHMQQAQQQAMRGNQQAAQQSGEQASQSLQPLGQDLREQRDDLRRAWRQEVLDAMDRALVEAADIAQRQEDIANRLSRGEAGAEVRGEQAAARDGVDRVIQRVQDAAGKNALISPSLQTALGFAKLRMNESLDQLQRPVPNTRQAGELAGQAVDALNAVALALLRSRSEVAGAQSGSGLQEAVEQMAQLAQQQGQINGQAGQLQPMVPLGGDQLMQELRAMAEQQRALAQELERLHAEGQVTGADALAEEARDLAGELEAGRLDEQTVERQDRLYHRLLDAGRSLRKDDEDEKKDRVSEAADPTTVRPPGTGRPPVMEPRFRYPTWDELRSLTPEERRLILDYFRRLNDGGR